MVPELRLCDGNSGRTVASQEAAPLPDVLSIALWCARQGWPVHPLASRRKTPPANCRDCQDPRHSYRECPCIPQGRWCHGFHAATLDAGRIRRWWTEQPGFGVGVACGPAGLVVIDVDAHETPLPGRDRLLPGIVIPPSVPLHGLQHGFHSLALLAALRGAEDPARDGATLRVRTPSGGLHIWYTAEPGHKWRCSAGSASGRALAWQVDVRACGGYIVAPGTRTAAGTYRILGPTRRPAPLPDWLAVELARTGHRPAPPSRRDRTAPVPQRARQAVLAAGGGSRPAEATLTTVLAPVFDCATVAEGAGFTEKLNRAAYTAGGLVAAGHLAATDAEAALVAAAVHVRPGQEHRARRIIQSGMNAGRRRPLELGG
ncbi:MULTISPECIES: bifunctional DNA primase/polymerase [unclassified Streptomyces]|uniref:bifunctional DNA primase/polymerase n=1 Tax=unclassified Streptomyces TaxID=2593676 RepID=UPI00081E7D5D|nr:MULTISPECIES: bifunctional DNA primase/polymerase [unclassified Streptomyces]MYZ34782.1 DNA primase [Streptomyces sp. SID4917]SCF70215.1 Bifunctional DNA primase/polymerase, N-terminal [Streptomyces sp. MnatMP-M17]